MIFYALNLLRPKSDDETLAWKARILTIQRGLEDVKIAVKHVSWVLSDCCVKSFSLEYFGQKAFWKFQFFVLPVSAPKAREMRSF